MLKWEANTDNTSFHLEKHGDHLYCNLSAGIWRCQVWINDHVKVEAWEGKVSLEDAQVLCEALHDTYKGWIPNV